MTRPEASTIGAGAGASVPVWDRTVRAVHWGLALGAGVCAVTGLLGPKNALDLHLAAAAAIAAHSAGHADTRAANLFRVVNVAAPRRMTATPAWRRLHGDVPDSVFGRRAIGTRGACAACHRDAATGRFDPQAIAVPQEITP